MDTCKSSVDSRRTRRSRAERNAALRSGSCSSSDEYRSATYETASFEHGSNVLQPRRVEFNHKNENVQKAGIRIKNFKMNQNN